MSGALDSFRARFPPVEGAFPTGVHLLVADRCNHACAHCYQVHGRKGEMPLGEIEALFAELAKLGVLFVEISGGEATLRPDLPEILRAARAHGFAITLLTNGYDMSPAVLAAIVEAGVWCVRISIYSNVASEHDGVTRVPGSFARTIASVRALVTQSIQVVLVSVRTSFCSTPIGELEAFAATLGCSLETTPALTAREDGSVAPLAVASGEAELQEYFRANDARDLPLRSVAETLDAHPCGACANGVTIQSDGSVRPCTHIPLELGRVGAEDLDLATVAQDQAFQLVAGLKWRDLHGCRDCALTPLCSRCHGSASFERGDLLGPQPSACRTAVARYRARFGPAEGPTVAQAHAPSADVGPFQIVSGTLIPVADRLTPEDEAMASKFRWLRPSKADLAARVGVVPLARLSKKARDGGHTVG